MTKVGNLIYDEESGLFVYAASVGKRKAGDVAGYVKTDGYRLIMFDGKYVYAHRLAWFAVYGAMPAGELDHLNGARDDNRIANLRLATRSQNMMNANSGRGWHWHSRKKLWQALIRVGGRRIFLGVFPTEDEARRAAMEGKAKFHGDFSVVNRPKPAKQEVLL